MSVAKSSRTQLSDYSDAQCKHIQKLRKNTAMGSREGNKDELCSMEYISSSELINAISLCLGRSWWISPLEKRLLKNRTAFTINNAPIPIAKRLRVVLFITPTYQWFYCMFLTTLIFKNSNVSCISMFMVFKHIQLDFYVVSLTYTFIFHLRSFPSSPTLIQIYLTWTWA